jgi:hypothetical protein
VAFAGIQLAWLTAAPMGAEPELLPNYRLLVDRMRGRPSRTVTYEKFVANRLFQRVIDRIGRPLDRVRTVAVGMHPGVLQMNGLYTLDAYASVYPLAYKASFRKIIAPELSKDATMRAYFDTWGSRCYVLTATYRTKYWNEDMSGRHLGLNALAIDFDAFRALGGTHIISAYDIRDRRFLERAHLLGVFSDQPTARDVYLYEVE